jgi:hypothetical protein
MDRQAGLDAQRRCRLEPGTSGSKNIHGGDQGLTQIALRKRSIARPRIGGKRKADDVQNF